MSTDTQTLYISRPQILVTGQVNAGLGRDVLAVLVEEHIDGLYRAEMILTAFGTLSAGNYGYLYYDRDVLDFGNEIKLKLGPGNPPAEVFAGRITALEGEYVEGGNARLVVLMEDRLQDLRMTRRTRSYDYVSDSDIIEDIAQEHGLTADVDLDGPDHRSVAQVNQSDLAFIRERARACGGEVWVEDTTLHVKKRSNRNSDPVTLSYGGSLFSFRVRADLANQCTEYSVSGWDVSAKDAIKETGTPSDISSELEGDTGGSSILQSKFGERVASQVHSVPLTGQEAQSLAKARYMERARRFVTGTGTCDGNASIRVGSHLQLDGLGKLFDGKYYVVRVRHTYTLAHGFRTEFDVERPGIGQT